MWALLGILLAPFRFARHIIGVRLFALALFLGLFALLLLSIWFSNWIRTARSPSSPSSASTSACYWSWSGCSFSPLLRRFDYDDRAHLYG